MSLMIKAQFRAWATGVAGFLFAVGRRGVVGVMVLLLLSGCIFGDSETSEELVGSTNVTPSAIGALPEDIGEVTITIADGAFDVENVLLQEGQPTVLHVVNNDDRAYRLKIGESLVAAEPIAASTTTDIQFTTPNADIFDGELLAEETDEVIATIEVVVRAPGGVDS